MTTPTKACEHCGMALKVRHKFSGDLVSPHQPASCRDSLRAQLEAEKREHAASVELHSRSGTIIEKALGLHARTHFDAGWLYEEYADIRAQLDAARKERDEAVAEGARARTECNDARADLIDAFVPAKDRVGAETHPLSRVVQHAIEHHNWHHDTLDARYVQTVEEDRDTALSQLAEAKATSARWKADYEEKCRAYSVVCGELSAAKMALAAAGALPGVTAIVTVDSRGAEAVLEEPAKETVDAARRLLDELWLSGSSRSAKDIDAVLASLAAAEQRGRRAERAAIIDMLGGLVGPPGKRDDFAIGTDDHDRLATLIGARALLDGPGREGE